VGNQASFLVAYRECREISDGQGNRLFADSMNTLHLYRNPVSGIPNPNKELVMPGLRSVVLTSLLVVTVLAHADEPTLYVAWQGGSREKVIKEVVFARFTATVAARVGAQAFRPSQNHARKTAERLLPGLSVGDFQ
jgi:hypothetical protein